MTNEFGVNAFSVTSLSDSFTLSVVSSTSKHKEKMLFIINWIFERCTVPMSLCKSFISSECFSPRTPLREACAPSYTPSSCWKQHSWPPPAWGAAPNWGRGPWQTAAGPEKAVPSNKGRQLYEPWLNEPEKWLSPSTPSLLDYVYSTGSTCGVSKFRKTDKLEWAQWSATRMAEHWSCKQRLKELGLLRLEKRWFWET